MAILQADTMVLSKRLKQTPSIVTAQLNTTPVGSDKVISQTKCCSFSRTPFFHPLKLLGHFQATYECKLIFTKLHGKLAPPHPRKLPLGYLLLYGLNKGKVLREIKQSFLYIGLEECCLSSFLFIFERNYPIDKSLYFFPVKKEIYCSTIYEQLKSIKCLLHLFFRINFFLQKFIQPSESIKFTTDNDNTVNFCKALSQIEGLALVPLPPTTHPPTCHPEI